MRISAAVRTMLLAGLLAGLAMALSPLSASAYEIRSFTVTPSTTQAGGHPNLVTHFDIENHLDPQLPDDPGGSNDARDIVVDLPAGVIGNPHAYPTCTASEFALSLCPTDSQIGIAQPTSCLGPGFCIELPLPLYNLEPRTDQAGLLGFKVILFNSPIYTEITARTDSDYGLRASTLGLQHVLPLAAFEQTLWGVPADPVHDNQRYADLTGAFPSGVPTPSNSPERPFMQNPTTCAVPLSAHLFILAYNNQEATAETEYPMTTGCAQLSFNPSITARPTSTEADSPSGLEVDLTVPQFQSPTTPSPSEIRTATIELPEGVSINPNTADGKVACTDVDARFGTLEQARCPESAKIGSLEIESAVLPGDLPGALYLGEPKPGDRYRVVLVADGFGLHVKLPGRANLDPQTGRVSVTFSDLPQFPFERFNLHIFGAERGLLATPKRCGTYAVSGTFVPWDAELSTQKSTQFFSITSGPGGTPCPGATRPFSPAFKAASVGNTAGAFAPFWLRLERRDGEQFLGALNVSAPPGFTGSIAGIPYCPEATLAMLQSPLYSGVSELAAPACPAASQIGTVVTGQGAGSRVVYTPGRVFLAGPYKGAPLSIVIAVPAVSGPYDLGTVTLRAALAIDPATLRISAISDPAPHILDGIPLRVRSVLINFDRPNFTLNPTNCDRFAVRGDMFGDEGGTAAAESHYQVANCANLRFGPRLKLRLSGGMKRRGHPAIHAELKMRSGESNVRRVAVTLPKGQLLDNSHIRTTCSRVAFAAGTCPEGSRIGTAIVRTPLLDQPLTGEVILRASSNQLPDLVLDLEGQVDVELSARVDAVNGRLRTTFQTVPDAPVSSVVLDLQGGSKGLLINSEPVCAAPRRMRLVMSGQNGRKLERNPAVAGCGRKARRRAGR
jgi:hypothetical protein